MKERLQKVLSRHGVASRRDAELMIRQGRISVNGRSVTALGTQADPEADLILIDDRPLPPLKPSRILMLNKPVGYLCTQRKSRERGATVFELIPSDRRYIYVGRLDRDSSGLLLLTDDGTLAHRLMHPRHSIKKVYRVVTDPPLSQRQIHRLKAGVDLDDGPAHPEQVARINTTQIEITVTEGRNRLIRRMIAAVGSRVIALHRLRIGALDLGSLPLGKYEILDESRVRLLTDNLGNSSID